MNIGLFIIGIKLVIVNSLSINRYNYGYGDEKLKRPQNLNLDYNYNSLETINEYIEYLARSRPDLVTAEVIGYTYHNSPIKALHVHNDVKPTLEKPSILIDAGIHAREWISPAAGLCILNRLVEHYNENKYLLDNVNWFIVPMLNPDGYNYTWHGDRFWRKNRQKIANSDCLGVDLNRNFGYKFGGVGTSKSPCEEIFVGDGPFSEFESRALRDYAMKIPNFRLYITMHSYGNFLIFPWGWTYKRPSDYDDMVNKLCSNRSLKLLEHARGQIRCLNRFSVKFDVDRLDPSAHAPGVSGLGAGGSDDYMKGVLGVKYSYTMELPGGGEEGFDFPAEKIRSVCIETWEGVKAFGNFIRHENYRRDKRDKNGRRPIRP